MREKQKEEKMNFHQNKIKEKKNLMERKESNKTWFHKVNEKLAALFL